MQTSEDIMAVDDDASVESYFFALNNLEEVVNADNKENKPIRELGRRASLSTLVVVSTCVYLY